MTLTCHVCGRELRRYKRLGNLPLKLPDHIDPITGKTCRGSMSVQRASKQKRCLGCSRFTWNRGGYCDCCVFRNRVGAA